eukprot:c16966_g1_i1.p1 GENE.c16966_g1_i1~~c16966_g1_i1.p1  ORF type:complete len:214 (-),score=19.82 c16966_g1_i1:323-964(-)
MQLDHNLNESRWRAPTQQSNFSEDTMVRLRGTRAVAGELEIALRWNDHNDLDLHVKCPCGTEIYFRNRTCPTCKGHLDVDMNVGSNVQDKPVEHIRFGDKDCPALPGTYLFWVVYYSGPKGNGGPSTEYLLEVKNSQTLKIGEFRGTKVGAGSLFTSTLKPPTQLGREDSQIAQQQMFSETTKFGSKLGHSSMPRSDSRSRITPHKVIWWSVI